MSETATGNQPGGRFATARRGGIDTYEMEFIQSRRERRVPVQHIANMLGRNVADVAMCVAAMKLAEKPEPGVRPTPIKVPSRPSTLGTTAIINAIIDDVEIRHELPPGSVVGYGSGAREVAARFEAYHLTRCVLNNKGEPRFSFPLLGKYFGRHHTSISTAVIKYRKRFHAHGERLPTLGICAEIPSCPQAHTANEGKL